MLLKKANTITTPTAYSNGFLHSVKPEVVWETFYESDFSVPYTGFISNLIGTTGESIAGVNDAIKLTLNNGLANHDIVPILNNVPLLNLDIRLSFDYYIPSTNAQVNGIFNFNTFSSSSHPNLRFQEIDKWTSVVVTGKTVTSGNVDLYFRALSGTSQTFSADGDVFYLKNIKVEIDISADFTFTRNSSATRVNALGYIEDVQIIGGELTSNGDFEEIGSELVTNGSFDTNSDWTLASGATISGGVLNFDSVTGGNGAYQSLTFTSQTISKVVVVCSEYTSGSMQVRAGTVTNAERIQGVGTYTYYLPYASYNYINLFIDSTFTGVISSVSVKEVGQDWTFGGGNWTLTEYNGSVVADFIGSSSGAYLAQDNVYTSGDKIRIQFTLSNFTSGQLRLISTGAVWTTPTISATNGTFTYDIDTTGASDGKIYFQAVGGSFNGYIDNVSVKTITDDTNLPRINYEGFTYENGLPVPYSGKGHLLLEGQRSNIALSGGPLRYTNATETTNYGVSPSGDNDSIKLESTTATTSYVRTNALSTIGNQCHSIYVKKGIGDYIQLLQSADANHYANYDIVNGVVTASGSATTASIESYGDWYRLIAVYDSVTNTAADARCYLSDSATAGFGSASSAIGNYCEFWGVQVEIGDYATSYIVNTTPNTTVTRLGETCNNATHSFPSEGVLYAEIAALANDGTNRMISISDASDQNHIRMYYTNTSNRMTFAIKVAGTNQVVFNYDGLDSVLDFHKVALRYQQDNTTLWVNGVQVDIDTSCNMPSSGALETLQFNAIGASNFYGKTKMVATFPYLSNDEMECLTGEGYGTFEALAAAYSYTIK